jgi:AcrR family transcriptional regulator
MNAKRAYDAASRRARGADQRAATRARVLDAAQELFEGQGYVATTVAQIADRAGVALQSVYATAGNKAALLALVRDLVVAGDERHVLMAERGEIAAIATLRDPADQVAAFAAVHAWIADRALKIWAADREAAAVDASVAEAVAEQHRLRLTTYRRIARMFPLEALSDGLDHAGAADTLWAIASPDTALLLRRDRRWSRARHETWLRETLSRALLRSP